MMFRFILALFCLLAVAAPGWAQEVRIKDLGRFDGWRDSSLVGYGIVTGLSGSGDSPRNEVARQALRNVLSRLGTNLSPDQMHSRNVAAVIVTATLPPTANIGDRIDATVTSIGDARSLSGGTLLMTPLIGPDQRSYALAQGSLVVGGYRFDSMLNSQQKNYPTAAVLPGGATIETSVSVDLLGGDEALTFVLSNPDFGTAVRIADGINAELGRNLARVRGADAVMIDARGRDDINRLIARIQDVAVAPDMLARVVVNERSGTVVAGGDVQISSAVISQGDIRVTVTAENEASQPYGYIGFGDDVRSLLVTNTSLEVSEASDAVVRFPGTTVADLVEGLVRVRVDTRGVIGILQALKTAGALHAELVVQ